MPKNPIRPPAQGTIVPPPVTAARRRTVIAILTATATALLALAAPPLVAVADGPTVLTNTTSIAIPATGSADQTGPASPYPSTIAVSGMAGAVSAVTVAFNGVTHSTLNDVDALLVSPTGANLVVLSDIGDPTSSLAFANNATLTFSDSAGGSVPIGNVPTGTYLPTNNGGGDAFPAPAPAPSSQTTLGGAFGGIDPNGTWSLYIVDDATGDIGVMNGGWSLTITTTVADATTVTTVTSSASPSLTGAPVTFTATVAAGGTPVTAGSVQFRDDTTALGAPVPLNAAGVAALTTAGLTEGTHSIRAEYSGAPGFLTSNGTVSQRVDNQTVVTGTTFCNPGVVTVPSLGAAMPYPSNITVSGFTTAISAVVVTLNGLSHQVPVDLDVMLSGPTPSQNLLLLSDVGGTEPVNNLTVTLDDAAATAVPASLTSGTFQPTDDDSDTADAPLPAPAPAFSGALGLSTFAGGSANGVWSLWVVDDASGDSGAISGGWCLTITAIAPTSTAVTSSLNPSALGQAVTLTATVTSSGSPVTAGTVQFRDGSTPLGAPAPVAADGTATLTTSALSAGTHAITAEYGGTAAYATSSDDLTQVVDLATTSTAVSSNVNPSSVGQSVTFTATVTSSGSPVAAGTVQFSDGGTLLGSPVPVAADGTATLTTSALAVGAHTITAAYSGSSAYAASADTISHDVTPAADPGGPYSVAEGGSVSLDASASVGGTVYEWDLDGDSDYSDATGVSPTLTWAQLESFGIDDGPLSYTISLRVTAGTQSATSATQLTVTNTAPTSVLTGGLTAIAGQLFTIKVGADDPSSADMAAMFLYTIDWGDGSPVAIVVGPADPPVTHTYASAGTFAVSFTATDKDGGVGPSTTVSVVASPALAPGALSNTGTDSLPPLTIAGLLLLVGFGLLLWRRRGQLSRP